MANTAGSIAWSVVGILVSGFSGALAGWGVVGLIGTAGVVAALVAAVVGMVVATAVWILITVLLRKAGVIS